MVTSFSLTHKGSRNIEWKNSFKAAEHACQQIVDCLNLQKGNILSYVKKEKYINRL